jgi:pseudaminic acid cytidylyltransferase
MRVAVIPARGGSKRIPRKNINPFLGKPIIAYSIEAAIASQCFDEIIVSTDDEEIASVAKTFGASIPFLRPQEFSDDCTPTTTVIKHAIDWYREQGTAVDYLCCLYATAPFVSAQSLKDGWEAMQEQGIDYAFSATSFPFPIQRAIKRDAKGRVEMFQPQHYYTRSQDLEDAYHDAGQFYWGKAEAFQQELMVFAKHSKAVLLPRSHVQDIDTEEDWARAELMYQLIQQQE